MMKKTSKNFAAALLVAVMVGSWGLSAFLTVSAEGDAQKQSLAASQSVKTTESGVSFTELSGVNNSDLFAQNYNPDVVKVNDIKESERRTAIVNLKGDTLLDYATQKGMSYESFLESPYSSIVERRLDAQIDGFIEQMNALGIHADTEYRYKTMTVGVSLTATGAELNRISGMEGVDCVVLSEHYAAPQVIEISNDTNVYSTGIYNTSEVDASLRGDGMVIAVLDTGMDVQHPAFQDENFKAQTLSLTKSDVEEKLSRLKAHELDPSATVETLYKRGKIPYAFDYADKDDNAYPSYSSHGVHVSGIIAGNYTEISEETVNSDEDLRFDYDEGKGTYYFEGVVPDAQIVALKVFTDDVKSESLGGAETEDILAALEDAVTLGVDVINMSLGSSAGFSSYADAYMEYVYSRIEDAGISLVCAASNDYSSGFGGVNGTNLTSNPDSATVGSPSTYHAAISVASINGQKDPYMLANGETMVFFTEATDGNSNKMDFIGDIFSRLKTNGQMEPDAERCELQYVVIPGLGRNYNYSDSIRQKLQSQPSIALVQRGTSTFEEKMKLAKENGAIGVIIYNNVAGTISMTMGAKDKNDIIPSCSISMDVGNALVLNAVDSVGTIVLDKSYLSGPFMSDFSSWGPTPSLSLKPEITAYGGNVTSAVAGGYDVYSGTSMASPNMAGAVAIIRQDLKTKHPDWSAKEIHDRAYQIMMSTAGIVLNESGNPYSPRKQGAGIADIDASLATQSYLYVEEKGEKSAKTKIELGDDAARTGKYTFTFYAENFSDEFAVYNVSSYVMTESVSSDGKTVAEKSKILTDSTVSITVNGRKSTRVSLAGGGTAEITVEITLSDAEKKYLDDNFKNGMFVEGFIVLSQAVSDANSFHDLSIPFLAFYGDWTDAPMLDYSSFEIAENEADDSIPDEDKMEIEFWATTPYTKYAEEYILPMGQYLYKMSDSMEPIYASEDKAAVSMYNEENYYTSYEFYAVYAGLLRGMGVCEAKIVNDYTGEIVWEEKLVNVSKGYANGGSTRPGFVKVEFNPYEMNLPGNTQFHFYMEGYLDYGDGTQGNNNSFDFTFYTDYEAPTVVDVALRYEDYVDLNEDVHTRIYLDVTTFDNHYTQAILLCYVDEDNYLSLLQEYITPVYADGRGQTVKTSIEITDYYEDYFDNMSLQVEDYAMNYSLVTLDLASAITFPENIEFSEETVTLAAGEMVRPAFTVTPVSAQHYDLIWESSDESVVRVEKGELYGVAAGEAYVTVYASNTDTLEVPSARMKVIVTDGTATSKYKSLSLGLIFNKNDVPVNPTNTTVEVNPNTDIQLITKSEPWYLPQMEVVWSSHNELVATVDENGLVHTLKEGMAVITARQVGGLFSVSVTLNVGPEFVISSYVLTDYYGVGGDVVVPEELNFMYIDEECFKGNTTITSFTVPEDVMEIRKEAFYGCTALRYVKFPKSLTMVEESAFEGCTSLETVDLTDALSVIFSDRCFYGCSSLQEIVNDERLTAAWDYTFAGCSSLETLNISNLVQVGRYSFANCTGLKNLTASRYTQIGEGMFFGCTGLQELELPVEYVGKDAFYACSGLETLALMGHCVLGEGAFRECSALNRIYFAGEVYEIGSRAFEGCSALRVLVMPDNAVTISSDAFARCASLTVLGLAENTKLSSFDAFRDGGNISTIISASVTQTEEGYDFVLNMGDETYSSLRYYSVYDGLLYNKERTEIAFVPADKESVTLPSDLKKIGNGAFYGAKALKSVIIPEGVTEIGDYAFSRSGIESITIPASVTRLGVGAFAYCYSLQEVVFAEGNSLIEIPEGCFNTTYELTSMALPVTVTKIGDYAFGASALTSLYAMNAKKTEGLLDGASLRFETIGQNAFAATGFTEVVLPQTLTELGDYAFATCAALETVTFCAPSVMGDYVFMDSTHLATVEFAEGMERVGDYAFVSMAGNTELSTVVLPSTLKEIGECAFWDCLALETVYTRMDGELVAGALPEGLASLGDYAFYGCEALSNINLSNVVWIGNYAFTDTESLTEANLASAVSIGDYAFYRSGIKEVSIPEVREIGEGGLAYTMLTKIDLPSSVESIGNGAFHYNFYLSGIKIEVNERYFIDDLTEEKTGYGVLYTILSDGSYQVVAYPGGNGLKSYSILNGTSRVGEMSFTGANVLVEIICPVTLESIADKGFYDCNARSYVFLGVNAPNLEARFFNGEDYGDEEWTSELLSPAEIFSRTGSYADEHYYANFFYYVMFSVYNSYDFGLTLTYPENGNGYDEFIWSCYFTDVYLGEETIDETTLLAVNSIKKIDADKIEYLLSADANDAAARKEAEGMSEIVKAAYNAYRNVLSETQMAFLGGEYDGTDYGAILSAAQQKMRLVKEKFNIAATVLRIRITSLPDKTEYVLGETLDTTGLVVTAEYDDGTTGVVTNYMLDRTTAYALGERVRINVTLDGKKTSFNIKVTEGTNVPDSGDGDSSSDSSSEVEESSSGNSSSGGNGGCGGCGNSLGAGGIAAILTAVAAAFILTKRGREE